MSKKVFLILLLFLIISSSLRIIFTKKHYSDYLEPVELIIEKGELPNVND